MRYTQDFTIKLLHLYHSPFTSCCTPANSVIVIVFQEPVVPRDLRSPRHDVPDYGHVSPNGFGYVPAAPHPDPYGRPVGNIIYGTYPRGIGYLHDPRYP